MSTVALPADASTATRLLLTIRQVAEATGYCEKTIWTNTAPRGCLACIRVGRTVRYTAPAVERWLETLTVGAQSTAPNKPASDASATLGE